MKQITLYTDNAEQIKALSNDDAGRVLKALLRSADGLIHVENTGDPDEIIKALIKLNSNDIPSRKKRFGLMIADKCPGEAKELLRAFYDYWTEHNANGKKMRFEMEKVFDIKRRVATFKKNDFGSKKNLPAVTPDISINTRMTS